MAITINVNGLSLVHRGSGGYSNATLPNVCLTPPNGAPVPYSNIAFATSLAGGTTTVRADGGNSIAVFGSALARSTGDEAGSLGGVVSGLHMGPASWITHSFDVAFEGRPAERHTDKMLHNRANTIDCGGVQNPPVPAGALGRSRSTHRSTRPYKVEIAVSDSRGAVQNFVATIEGPVKRGRKRSAITRRKNSVSASDVTFTNLRPGRYTLTVAHPCHLVWQKRVSAVTVASTQKVNVQLEIPSLLAEAQAKNRVIYMRVNGYATVDDVTAQNEFRGGIMYTGWSSRCGSSPTPDFISQTSPLSVFEAAANHQIGLGLELMGTPLVWNASTPTWANAVVDAATFRRMYPDPAAAPPGVIPPPANAGFAELAHIARAHTDAFIRTTLGHFPGRIKKWVVCNEQCNVLLLSWARGIPFWRYWGEWNDPYDATRPHKIPPLWHSVLHSLELAHRMDPTITLILNDYGTETWDGKHRHFRRTNDYMIRGEQFFRMAEYMTKHLSSSARRKFAVGFQMHWDTGRSVPDLKSCIARYHRQLGLEVVVTELSVKMTNVRRVDPVRLYTEMISPATPAQWNAIVADLKRLYSVQRPLFESIYDVLLSAPNVRTIMHWGIDDAEEGPAANPDTLDTLGYIFNSLYGCAAPYAGGYNRKPAYVAICEALRRSKRLR